MFRRDKPEQHPEHIRIPILQGLLEFCSELPSFCIGEAEWSERDPKWVFYPTSTKVNPDKGNISTTDKPKSLIIIGSMLNWIRSKQGLPNTSFLLIL